MKKVTLTDIAKRCGVSAHTVSYALKDKPDISEKRKNEIRKVAEEMGYIGNYAASYLRTGESKSIGIIIGDIINPFFSICIHLIEEEMRKRGYNCMVFDSQEDEKLERKSLIAAIGKSVDGIILSPTSQSNDNIRFLIEQKIPFVLMGRYCEEVDSNYVISDEREAGRQAAQYLLDNQCKRIACLMMDEQISCSKGRMEGIRNVFQEAKMSDVDYYFVPAGLDTCLPYMEKIGSTDYDGVICFCDKWALKLISHVAPSVKIVSFDAIISHFWLPCKWASIGVDKELMCSEITRLLIDLKNEQKTTTHCVLQPKVYY